MLKCCNDDVTATGQNQRVGDTRGSEVSPASRTPTYVNMSPGDKSPPCVNPASGDISSGDYMDLGETDPQQPSTYTELQGVRDQDTPSTYSELQPERAQYVNMKSNQL